MANKTTNYKLTKPLPSEFYDIEVHNTNMDIIDEELKKRATLDNTGKVPTDQLPSMNYIPSEQKGSKNGVATLDNTGKVPSSQLPEISGGSGKRTTRFTVGSSQYGWTASDCDYLCDGTADEVEINAAIQALRSTGGEVVLLDGLYNLTSAILINKDNVTLSGNGANTKIIRAFDDDEYADQQGMVIVTNSFCTIKNLYFDGVKGNYTSNAVIGIHSGDNCIVANNTVVNSSCDGIYVKGNYHTIDNNIITGCNGNGLYLYSGNKYTVTNNKITGSTSYGMYLYNVKDSAIGNNVCMDNTDCGIKIYWCDRCTFTGNVLNNNNQCGLYLTRGEGNVISGNTFVGNGYYGIYLNSYSADTIVMSNAFLNNTSGEIRDGGSNNTLYFPDHTHSGADITRGLDVLATAIGACRIQTGSYTGTGTVGSTNPNTLTFNFVPKVVIIGAGNGATRSGEGLMVYIQGNPNMIPAKGAESSAMGHQCPVSLSGTTLSWYTTSTTTSNDYNIQQQANTKNPYYWVALG